MREYHNLDERQVLAIDCLMKGMSVTEVAKEVGVSRQTIYDWMKIEKFKNVLDECLAENKTRVERKIIAKADLLTNRLLDIALDKKISAKTSLDAISYTLNRILGTPTNKTQEVSQEKTKEEVDMDKLLAELDKK